MSVYIVTKDAVPFCATFSRNEASAIFDDIVHSGRYRQAATLVVSPLGDGYEVLQEAYKRA
ncbi:MAG: hypothetical protein MI920_12685 [Kiloniellales bacterium]|nr:hypothetical protein [Kiloniellales bacterium]